MTDYFFELKDIYPYIYGFPILILVLVVLFLLLKRNIDNKSISFYGMFMSMSKKDVFSLSLILLFAYIMVVSVFVNKFSIMDLSIFVPIILFNTINLFLGKLILDTIHASVLSVLLYLKVIFYNYIIDVGNYWYVVCIYIILCLFILLYTVFFSLRRFKSVIQKNKYVK